MDANTSAYDIDSLKRHDFAFVKRSDGTYTYAILAFRSSDINSKKATVVEEDSEEGDDEKMVFVMNNNGSTKIIRKKYWSKLIRFVSMKE